MERPPCYADIEAFDLGTARCRTVCPYKKDCGDSVMKRLGYLPNRSSSAQEPVRVQSPSAITPVRVSGQPTPTQIVQAQATAGTVAYRQDDSSPGRELFVRTTMAAAASLFDEAGRFFRTSGYRLFEREPKQVPIVLKCPSCQGLTGPNAKFCQGCGVKFS